MDRLKFKYLLFICGAFFIALFQSCGNTNSQVKAEVKETINVYDTNSPETMLLAVSESCGGMNKLKSLNDVEYDYFYVYPDGKKDISKERYIFDNETSWAEYTSHEINFPAELEGNIVQFFDGEKAMIYNNGSAIDNPELIGTSQFLRQANYMWFTMMFKLTDPGILYKYEGQKEVKGQTFDVVNITYDPKVTGKEENDIYIVYINPETKMVDNFYFSLPAMGMLEPILHAELTYEKIDGIQVIVKRIMTAPSSTGSGRDVMVDQQLKNVKFNNGFTKEQLSQEII